MGDMVALQGHGLHWDAVGHGDARYEHGPTGVVIVPQAAAVALQHTGGYAPATRNMIQAEIDMLEARIADLRQHLQ